MPTDPDRIVFCVKCEAMIGYSAVRCRSCGAKQPRREARDEKTRKQQAKKRETAALKEATASILREQAEAEVSRKPAGGQPEIQGVTRGQMNALIALVAGLLIATTVLAVDTLRSTGRPEYEYQVKNLKDGSVYDLKSLGDDGWEVMSARRARDYGDVFSYEVIVRRRK